MNFYIGLDSGTKAGVAVLQHNDDMAEVIFCSGYSSNGSLTERLPSADVYDSLTGAKPHIAIESLEWRHDKPQSITVMKGVARMQGIDINSIQSRFRGEIIRYTALKNQHICDILNIHQASSKRDRWNKIVDKLYMADSIKSIATQNEHVRDAIVLAYCARYKLK